MAEQLAAGVYFNTLVRVGGRQVKYGVASTASALEDMINWDRLYVAGRLHKPVRMLAAHPLVQQAQQLNQRSALTAALLLMQQRFRFRVSFYDSGLYV